MRRRARPPESHAHDPYQPHESYEPRGSDDHDESQRLDDRHHFHQLRADHDPYESGHYTSLLTGPLLSISARRVALEGVRRGVAALTDSETVAALRLSSAS